jgi:hypothetical protein
MVGVGPTDKGLAAYDKGNWNKVFLVWDHRIRKENKVNAVVPAPRTEPPRSPARFLFPQTTSQDIGFLLDPDTQAKHSVLSGLTNFFRYKNEIPRNHHLGLVTLTGDFLNDRHLAREATAQRRAVSEVSARSAPSSQSENPENSRLFHVPGDWHLRPHEWAYLLSRAREIPGDSSGVSPDSISEVQSTTSTAVHRQHRRLQARMREAAKYLPGKTPYNFPLSNSDVALYADAYVKSFACGPFDKHQLLANR